MVRTFRPVALVVFVAVVVVLLLPTAAATAQASDPVIGKPVSPVVSPPLREIPPIQTTRDPGKPRDAKRLPFRGALPGAAPAGRRTGALQLAPAEEASRTQRASTSKAWLQTAPPRPIPTARSARIISSSGSTPTSPFTTRPGPFSTGRPRATLSSRTWAERARPSTTATPSPSTTRWPTGGSSPSSSSALRLRPSPISAWPCRRPGIGWGSLPLRLPDRHNHFVDYPKWTTWTDAYYMTAHLFNAAGTVFLGAPLYSFSTARACWRGSRPPSSR